MRGVGETKRALIMHKLPSLFPLFFGRHGYSLGWRQALKASMWSIIPAVFCSGAHAERHRLHAIPFDVRCDKNKCGELSLHTSSGSLVADKSQLFLRQRRTTRNSGEPQREVEADGDAQFDVTNATGVAEDNVVRAFDRWAKKSGGCTADEFIQGVHQSYYGLGVLCETLTEAAAPQPPHGKAVSLDGALKKLKNLLAEHYAVSSAALADEVKALGGESAKKMKRKEGTRTSKTVAEALTQVLPISLEFGETMYNMWNKQRVFDSNVLRIAASNDYILSAKMILFYECNNLKELHFAKDAPMTVIASTSLLDSEKKEMKTVDADNKSEVTLVVGSSNLSSESHLSNEKEKEKLINLAIKSAEDKTTSNKSETIITFNDRKLPTIPAGAVACVTTLVDVVTPPQRYYPSFDWYYNRISGHENEYQRIALARFFSMSNAQVFLSPLDFLVRMFTGKHLNLVCPPKMSDVVGIPKNIAECPPSMRKLLCFYLDADGRWVLTDLFCVDSVTTPLVVKTAPA